MSFGSRLEALIQERVKKEKFSQSELARQLGVTRDAVSKWVTGKAEPNIETLLRISKILEVNVCNLLGDVHDEKAPPLDSELLKNVICFVEETLQEERAQIPPEKKSFLILTAYEMAYEYFKNNPKEGDRKKALAKLIRLAA